MALGISIVQRRRAANSRFLVGDGMSMQSLETRFHDSLPVPLSARNWRGMDAADIADTASMVRRRSLRCAEPPYVAGPA